MHVVELLLVGAATALASGAVRSGIEYAAQLVFVGALRLLGLYYDHFDNVFDNETQLVTRRLVAARAWTLQPALRSETLGAMLLFCARPFVLGWATRAVERRNDKCRHTLMLVWSRGTRTAYLREDRVAPSGSVAIATRDTEPLRLVCVRATQLNRNTCEVDVPVLELSWPRLHAIVETIYRAVKDGGAALLCGSAGVGKSSMAQHLAQRMRAEGLRPQLLVGIALSSGVSLEWMITCYGVDRLAPLIVVLDEFDTMVEELGVSLHAKARNSPLANSKSELATFLDMAAQCPNLIIVATSNRPLAWWTGGEHAYVVRDGRFDVRLNLEAPTLDDLEEAAMRLRERGVVVPRLAAAPPLSTLSKAVRKHADALGACLEAWT